MTLHRRAALLGLLSTPATAFAQPADFGRRVALGAEARTLRAEIYDPSYRVIAYPMGDVADDRGPRSRRRPRLPPRSLRGHRRRII